MPSIERDNLAGLIPEPVSREIFQGVVESSSVLKVGRRLPNMTSQTQSINVLDMLPIAYWVNGDMGFKQTAAQAWEKKTLHAGELAVIVPIPEAVLADSNGPENRRSHPLRRRQAHDLAQGHRAHRDGRQHGCHRNQRSFCRHHG